VPFKSETVLTSYKFNYPVTVTITLNPVDFSRDGTYNYIMIEYIVSGFSINEYIILITSIGSFSTLKSFKMEY
jgi:hypothetical protein